MKLGLFIPCYNCEEQVKRVILSLSNIAGPIYFIDNASNDDTSRVIETFCNTRDDCFLLQHHQNYGLGGSFMTAVEVAKEKSIDWIAWFHGDDQAKISDLGALLEATQDKNIDAVLGSRFMHGSKRINYSNIRWLGNLFFNLLSSLILRRKVCDIGSGFNLYRTSSLLSLDVESWPSHIAFDMNLLFYYTSQNKMIFKPIQWDQSDQKSNAKNLQVGLDIIFMLYLWIKHNGLVKSSLPSTKRVFNVKP